MNEAVGLRIIKEKITLKKYDARTHTLLETIVVENDVKDVKKEGAHGIDELRP